MYWITQMALRRKARSSQISVTTFHTYALLAVYTILVSSTIVSTISKFDVFPDLRSTHIWQSSIFFVWNFCLNCSGFANV